MVEKVSAEANKLIDTIPADIRDKVTKDPVQRVSVLRGLSLKATGMNHKFTPSTSLLKALSWLIGQEGQGVLHTLDFTFLYENGNGLIFIKGEFNEFENMEDED